MSESMYVTASSAMDLNLKLEVLANNLANVNTVGFKEELISVRNNQTVNDPSLRPEERQADQVPNLSNEDQLIHTRLATYTNFQGGPLMKTGNPLDLAISGSGFFKVQVPEGVRYTRNGSFTVNAENKLTTQQGALVMGERGAINIDGTQINIDDKGNIFVDGDEVDKLKIVWVDNLKSLKRDENLLFKQSGFGTKEQDAEIASVQQGYLERSNVNSIKALTDTIGSLRLFETYQKVIQTVDQANAASISDVGRPG